VDTAGLRKRARIEAPLEKMSVSSSIEALKMAEVVALTVDATDTAAAAVPAADAPLVCGERTELDTARLVLEAHENLVSADEDNRRKFQDVLVFMKNRVEQG